MKGKQAIKTRGFGNTLVRISVMGAIVAAGTAAFADGKAYLISYFSDNAYGGRSGQAAGLRIAYSYDGKKWTALNGEKPFLVPEVGKDKLMRDPSICQGPDGTFHLVWTTSWHDRMIGYASSKDLVHWSAQQSIPVMAHEPTARNCWAPEVTYNPDDSQFYIYWATTIPGRHYTKGEKSKDGHRIYLTTTKDWKTFSPTRLWFNPDYSAIDAALVRPGKGRKKWLMFVKNENSAPVAKNIRTLWTDSLSGELPKESSKPITGNWVEGPTPLMVGSSIYLYFDCYTKHRFGAVRSDDMGETWRDVSNEVSFPKGIRHGTAFAVDKSFVDRLVADCAAKGMQALVPQILGIPMLYSGTADIGKTVRDSLFNEVVRQDRAADAAWLACDTKEKLAARQARVRAGVLNAIGGLPEKTPLNACVTGRIQKDGYVIEKVLFESRPHHYVTAHLFLPDSPKYKAPYPGVVSPCGHSLTGKNAPWYQRVGVTGAMHGLATLVYDPIDQGERRQHPKCHMSCGGHNSIGWRANLLGWNTAQFRIWDGVRACDYLASRTDVDAAKLGVTGLSGGGTLSSYLNALDDRYVAGAPAGFLSTIRDVYAKIGGQDAEQFLFGQMKIGFNHLGIVTLRAPSPTMIVTTHGDYFPFMGSMETFENARKIYSMLGVPERVDLMETAGPHHWYESTRNAAMLWIRRWAAGDASAWPQDRAALRRLDIGFSFAPENSGVANDKPEVYRVTKTGQVMDIPGARSVYDVMKDELKRLDEKRVPPTVEGVRAVSGIRPVSGLTAVPAAVVEKPAADGRAVRLVLSRTDDFTPIPMVAFLPKDAKGVPLLLFTDGKRTTLADEIRAALGEGRAVAVAEMRGFGETAKGDHSFYGSKRPDEEMSVMAISVGENLAARRAEDVALAARHFASMAGVRSVSLSAHGAACIPAAHAFYLERGLFSSFGTKNPPPSWHEVVKREQTAFSFADSVYGALRTYDWTDLVAP